jgi:hypothetical protein
MLAIHNKVFHMQKDCTMKDHSFVESEPTV